MNRVKKWLLRGLIGLVALTAVAALMVFIASENILGKTYTPEEREFAVPAGAETDPEIIAEGGRLARIRGCYDGCHGPGGAGENFFGMASPNLTRRVREYSDKDLERVIRQGIRPDGASVIAVMPSVAFQYLSDEDLSSIIAFFRSLPVSGNDPGPRGFGPQIRAMMFFLTYVEDFQVSAADAIGAGDFLAPDDRSSPGAFGRYLAMSICAECHGPALHGEMDMPDLMVASGYNEEEFRHLLATGESFDDRDLGLMAEMSRRRFSHLHSEEVDAIHAWLTSDEFMMEERE